MNMLKARLYDFELKKKENKTKILKHPNQKSGGAIK